MQALTLPASRGLRWLIEGFAIFRRKPILLTFLVFGYWLSMAVISAIPYLGQIISFVLIPAFSVSLMNACRIVDEDDVMPPQVLFSGFHRNLQALLALGATYVVASMGILGLSALFDGGILFRMLVVGEMPDPEALAGTSVFIAAQLAIVLLVPVMMAFWFAPVLAAWHDMSAGKSLFFSLVASVRNWRAFLTYSLAVGIIGIFVPRLLGALGGGGSLAAMFTVALSMVLLPTVYASFYVSYRDVFGNLRDAD
ncbi:BPSS1780 family membrane protein [Propionivibrio sp.]|uniref:BPSS1780 family membrane protein n=1 Tax=Propionivibrio sp. TaxID=2212460 RepID=UPI00272E799C|nr:BPSS1780 family membrane protein [Propionivibrio sp.]